MNIVGYAFTLIILYHKDSRFHLQYIFESMSTLKIHGVLLVRFPIFWKIFH